MARQLIAAFALIVASAAAAQSPAAQMAELVDSWVGRTLEQLIDVWGDGETSTARASGNTVYTYVAERRRSTIHTAGVAAVQMGLGACAVSFEVHNGVIVAATWTTEGSRDREQSRRACWREFRRKTAD